jgi:hypothetical protein
VAIEGYYRTGIQLLPAPHVQAVIQLPRIGIEGAVDFLIDTGADHTCLHPGDIAKLAIDYRRLRRRNLINMAGIGGSIRYSREIGLLLFRDNGGEMLVNRLDIYICLKTAAGPIQGLPSLLGRDFLNLCSFSTDKSKSSVLMEPLKLSGNVILPP